ncbi:MAG TPA: TonB-dependent receptor, partial [Terriglobia bacterium]|nr:TonB-dependent receptor [Terriglobia bacterium]
MRISTMVVVTAFIWMAGSLQAAPAGRVRGVVSDPSRAAIPGAMVTLQNRAVLVRRTTVTDQTGVYDFVQLSPGVWSMVVEAPQFKRVAIFEVIVQVDQITHQDVTLPVGEVSEIVEVHARLPLVGIDRSTSGAIVTERSIASLPLNGRQFLDLAALTPGVLPTAPGTQGSGFSSTGMRSQSNVYLLDGISNIDTQTDGPLNLFRITEAVQEFAVQTGATFPEFGRGSGAQVNIVTRSGTNRIHGSAFEYLRNTALNASDFFTNKLGGRKNDLIRNQFGGAGGGPIVRDRTFFFASYEAFRQEARAVSSVLVPTAAQRETVADPISQRLLAYWPLPNAAGAGASNYIANVRSENFDTTGLVRIDHRIRERDQLSGRWTGYWGRSFAAGPTPLTGGNLGPFRQRSVMMNESHTFTRSFLNELRFGYSLNSENRTTQDSGLDASTIFTDDAGSPLPGVVRATSNPANSGLPQITVGGGFAPIGTGMNFPQGRTTDTYELFDNMSWRSAGGRHALRWGWHGRREGLSRYLNRAERGTMNFANFADFARGQLTSSTFRTGSTQTHWTRYPWDIYFQDEFRVSRNLRIHYGVRYESPSAIAERDNHAVNFVPGYGPMVVGTNQIININPVLTGSAALTYSSAPFRLPSTGVYADRNNVAPMFGFAYGGLADTVIRGGYRVAYDDLFNNVPAGMALGPPQNLQTTQTANVTQPAKFAWAVAFNQNVPLISNFGKQGPGTPTAGVLAFQGVDPHLRSAYAHLYNFGIERTVGETFSIDAFYQGSAGHHLGMYVDVNQPAVIVRDPTRRGPVAPNEQVFPYSAFGQAQVAKSIGNSNYNAGTLTARYQRRGNVFVQASYTFGKSLDVNSSYFGSGNLPGETGAPIDATNIRLDHGPSAFDVRHRAVVIYRMELPWGFQVSGITMLQTGTPFTVTTGGPDTSGFNQTNSGASPNPGNRPDLTEGGPLRQDNRNPDAAFDPSRFTAALAGRSGTAGRNAYYGPALENFDLAIARSFRLDPRLGDQSQLLLRADFFNLLNHTNFANPIADISNANFGKITQTRGSAVATSIGTTGGPVGGPRLI